MAKIICITSGLTGIVNASFELMRRLEVDGHEVLCAGPPVIAEKVLAQGVKFEALSPLNFHPTTKLPDAAGTNKWARLYYRYQHKKELGAAAVQAIYPADYDAFLEKNQPDLLLVDLELHEYIIIATSRKIPVVLLNQFFSFWKRPGLPCIMHDTIPGEGFDGTTFGIGLAWFKVKLRRWIQGSKQKIYSGYTDRHSSLLALAKRLHFPSKYIGGNYWPGPFIYDELPVVNMVYEELEFPHDQRPNSFYVGPMVYEHRKDRPAQTVNDYTLEDAFAYIEKHQAKLIYCSVSTLSKSDSAFLLKVIQAIETEENWVLIMSLGGLGAESAAIELAPNVFTFSYIPQLNVLAQADCSINHGGMHTINECIHFGVPMLIYSGGKADQNGTSARVVYHELGLRGNRQIDGVEQIRSKIRKVLSNEIYQENITTFQKANNKYRDHKLVERVIENLSKKQIY